MERLRNELGLFHRKRFEDALKRLEELAGSVDALYILTYLSVTHCYIGISDAGRLSASWNTPQIPQAGIELFQALALRGTSPVTRGAIPLSVALEELHDLLPKVLESVAVKRMADVHVPVDDEAKSILLLQEGLRLHTQQIRNWAYYQQSLGILKELYSPLDSSFQDAGVMAASKIVSLFEMLITKGGESASEHIRRLRPATQAGTLKKAVHEYSQAFAIADGEDFLSYCREKEYGLEEVKYIMYMNSLLHLEDALMIGIEDVASALEIERDKVDRTLGKLSIGLGELHDQNVELFFLDNPVWTRPLIRLDNDTFFCPLPQLCTGFAFVILDGLCAHDDSARKAIELRRARFLEEMVEVLFRKAFPGSQFFRNVKWRDGDTEYETDLVAAIDSYLLIVEAKSGAVSWPALRGAPARAKKHIKELIVQPSVQSKRVEEKIRLLTEGECEGNLFVDSLPLDFASIRGVARLSVTLENFATIQTNVVQLGRTGWLPVDFDPAPTMSLADLQSVLTILGSPAERLHYLVGRAELERRVPYQGDELDLLGYYLKTGFCTGSLGQDDEMLVLHQMSFEVDEFMMAKEAGLNPRKPRRKMTEWWRDILAQIESNKPQRWFEAALMLLSVDLSSQQELGKRVRILTFSLKTSAALSPSEESIILTPDHARPDTFAVVALRERSVNDRHARMQGVAQEVFSCTKSSRCLVLALNVDSPRYPYQALAVFERHSLKPSCPPNASNT